MALDDYKVVLYRNQPSGWVAEVPSIAGCYALMPTRSEALSELERVFVLIEEEYRDGGVPLPADTTEVVHAWRPGARIPSRRNPARLYKRPSNRQSRTMDSYRRSRSNNSDSWWTRNRASALQQDIGPARYRRGRVPSTEVEDVGMYGRPGLAFRGQ